MKRLPLSMIAGAILGIFCILGVGFRMGFSGNEIFLLSIWYNRVVMGLVIGLLPKKKSPYMRGAAFGLIVSLASYLSTNFRDIPSFFAGIVYGIIIDLVATRYSTR